MFKGKVALVTGSTSGIGLNAARRLASHGCNIMLNGLGEKVRRCEKKKEEFLNVHAQTQIEKIQSSIESNSNVKVLFDGADLSVASQVEAMVRRCERELGRVDVLVNNAGIQHVSPVESFPLDRWRSILDINLTAVFVATAAALPGMKARAFGRIINVASVHGLVASVNKSAYVAAKHGVVGFTKAVALETAQHQRDVQRRLSRLGAHRSDSEADRTSRLGEADVDRARHRRSVEREAAVVAVCHRRSVVRHHRVSGVGRSGSNSRSGIANRWWLDISMMKVEKNFFFSFRIVRFIVVVIVVVVVI
jgi:NAD(P)-dependent dehydrogenase (short-subunit alcohol dehydrogenase family)